MINYIISVISLFIEVLDMYKKLMFLKTIIYLIAATIIFILHDHFVEGIDYLISSILFLYGLSDVAISFFEEEKYYETVNFYFGLVELFLGMIVIVGLEGYEDVCIIWGVWSIFRESFEIKELVKHLKNKKYVSSIINLIESIIVIILSTFMLFEPSVHHASIHIYLLVSELIISSIIPITEAYFNKKNHKKPNE